MAVDKTLGTKFVSLCSAANFSLSSVLQIGRQDVFFALPTLLEMLARFNRVTLRGNEANFSSPEVAAALGELQRTNRFLAQSAIWREHQYISDHCFFTALGFKVIRSVDASNYENADRIHDLNNAGLLEAVGGAFDVVYEGGTLEHVFHVPHALENIASVCKVGGFVFHTVPVNNNIDHGYYQFSPSLLFDFYSCNGFAIRFCTLFRYMPRRDIPQNVPPHQQYFEPFFSLEYEPGCLSGISDRGTTDNAFYMLAFAAQKTTDSPARKIPQQASYIAAWNATRR